MAIYQAFVKGDLDTVLNALHEAIIKGSSTISMEESLNVELSETKLAIRAYERYSILGQNRVSLHLTVAADAENTHVTVISTGGSQGALFKMNTFSEENFLSTVIPAIEKIKK